MEYLSVKSTAKRMLLIATECIKHFVISVFLYRQNKWSWILGLARGNPQSAAGGRSRVEGELGDVSPLPFCVIHLSVTHFCWANRYLLAGCLWIHPRDDMKAITLHKIRDIPQENRSDVSLKIAFLSLPNCLILYVFHSPVRMGKEAAAFCIWLCVTFRRPAVRLGAALWQTRGCCCKDKRSSWNLSLWCRLLATTLAF